MGQCAFLTSTNDNLFFQLAKSPVTRYCVEHEDTSSTGFAPYISCNGPEAKPRNDPADPICICDVYADRMIALQSKTEMDGACGPGVMHSDGTHTNPDCNCTGVGVGASPSKWAVPTTSYTHIGLPLLFSHNPSLKGGSAPNVYAP
jgi:hypothetical protein